MTAFIKKNPAVFVFAASPFVTLILSIIIVAVHNFS